MPILDQKVLILGQEMPILGQKKLIWSLSTLQLFDLDHQIFQPSFELDKITYSFSTSYPINQACNYCIKWNRGKGTCNSNNSYSHVDIRRTTILDVAKTKLLK